MRKNHTILASISVLTLLASGCYTYKNLGRSTGFNVTYDRNDLMIERKGMNLTAKTDCTIAQVSDALECINLKTNAKSYKNIAFCISDSNLPGEYRPFGLDLKLIAK